jgi:hypothetical protein
VSAAALLSTAAAAADDNVGDAPGAGLAVTVDSSGSDIDYAIDLPGLLQIGTGTGAFTLSDADGDDLGSFTDGDVNVVNILGIETMQFAFDSGNFSAADDGGDLPEDGTSYSVIDFGLGIQNIYEAAPTGADGGGPEITDTVVTPLGTFGLPTTLAELFTDGITFDGGGGLLGGADGGELDPDTTIVKILEHNDVDSGVFTGGDLSDVGNALADSDDVSVAGGDVTAGEVTAALEAQGIGFDDPGDFGAQDLADVLNGTGTDEAYTGFTQFFDTVFGDGAIFDKIADTLVGDLNDLFGGVF